MLIIYRKSNGEVVDNQGTNELFPYGIPYPEYILTFIALHYGGKVLDYDVFRLHDVEDKTIVNKTSTHEYTIQNGEIVFGTKKPVPVPEPQPPSEIDLLRLEMARGNAELFENMLFLMGGV